MFNKEAKNVLFNLTMKNIMKVGNKKFAYVPMSLLFADYRLQRSGAKAKRKIEQLASNWNPNKMDPLRVVPHYEDFMFSIVDGLHRFSAALINGVEYIVCEIIELSDDPAVRLVEEATLFATQDDQKDPLSPIEKHKANVARGVWENIELQRIADKYGISVDGAERSSRKENYLSGFACALGMVKTDNATTDKVLYTLRNAGWNFSSKGLSNNALRPMFNIFRLHGEYIDQIVDFLGDYLREVDPGLFFSRADEKYSERRPMERIMLYLEDTVVDNLHIPRVYFGGIAKVA